jgi:hypothetical protein
MAELTWLPPSTIQWIDETVRGFSDALGPELEAVALVGNAVHPARPDRAQSPEIVAVAKAVDRNRLQRLADALRRPMSHGVRVRLFTRRELERSADVFSVEIAEYQAHHVMLHGDDPFAAIAIRRADLRRSLEEGLRGLGRKVRNRVLAGLATDRRRDDPWLAVSESLDRLIVLARHVLVLCGERAPAADKAVIEAAAAKAHANAAPIIRLLQAARGAARPDDPLEAATDLLAMIEPLVELVDRCEVRE